MTKADLVDQVAEVTGLTKKETATVIDEFIKAIIVALSDSPPEHIEIRGFGTFRVKQRKSRQARNPRTGDSVDVPAKLVPTFKASKDFKSVVTQD